MERIELETKIISLIKTISKAEECHIDMELMDEIGFSSIDVMDLVTKCEVEFGVKISARDLRKVYTPGDLADLIEAKL